LSKHGLSPENQAILKAVLKPYASKIETVGLFGSRAQGTYRESSDIDMVLYGSLAKPDIDRLYTLFEESELPVKVDIHAYDLIDYPPLKHHIDKVMIPLFSKKDLQEPTV
jgi:predicted nucleotidyltransferase